MNLRLFACSFAAASLFALPALADKIAVLPFSSNNNVPRPELEEVRKWTDDAVLKKGHAFASPDEMVSAMATVRDGLPDTSSEYIAAGNAVGAPWTLVGRVQRDDVPPSTLPDGSVEEGYTLYRLELEACQVATGRVESLSREILPDDTNAIAEMIALLIRPEGLANEQIPWERANYPRPKPKPKAPPPPAPPPPPPAPVEPPAPPPPRLVYGAKHPVAFGAEIGVNGVIASPSQARGPSAALPLGIVGGYAFPDDAPGLELRGSFTGQAAGPKAFILDAGARYALAPVRGVPFFVGPEAMIGAHIASGVDRTTRFYAEGSLFAAYAVAEQIQLELAGDLAVAAGNGSLGFAGVTARVVFRF